MVDDPVGLSGYSEKAELLESEEGSGRGYSFVTDELPSVSVEIIVDWVPTSDSVVTVTCELGVSASLVGGLTDPVVIQDSVVSVTVVSGYVDGV